MIFQDETGKRWFKVKALFFTSLLMLLGFVSLFILHRYGVVNLPWTNKFTGQLFAVMKQAFIAYLFFTIVLGFVRMFIIYIFCFKQHRKNKVLTEYRKINKNHLRNFRPSVTVIIPVYNEEVVIRRTVRAILKSDYPVAEILIVDDGSTDQTAEIATKIFHLWDKVKVIKKVNGGKSSALNLGFKQAIGDIVITIDADTVFHKSTISHLVDSFSDPRVAAVSGNCKIGNIINQITLWQHIEYVTANQLEKRAFEELNCITVVPGSNSAWRKSVVQKLGYYHKDTLAEDSELTLRILNAGYKIVYEDRAISYEECPETVRDFIKQRNRWSYGILQVAWKHKKNILTSSNKTLKYFAVPSLLFSYLLFLTSPLIDFIFIAAILSGTSSIYLFALLFYLTDFLNSFIAFKMGKEKMKPLMWVFIQRIGYRYLLAYVTWTAVIRAFRGRQVGWRKLNRSGNNAYKV
ncbi:glycosyltransferase [Lysinibacillus sp. LZ02]|uniref:glycosyltransferase n=1 Tax=Lysinibacillus sp. LZ02 TaxID=3420668 RepID=UPI003D36E61F